MKKLKAEVLPKIENNSRTYETQRRGPDHRRLHDILHQRGDLLTGQSS